MRKFLLVVCMSFLVGCKASLSEFTSENRKNLASLSPGMSKEQVHAVMGNKTVRSFNNPYRTAMQYNKDNQSVEVFYYWTDGTGFDGVQDNELTPVVFVNGKVVGWGREFFSEFVKKYEIRVR